MNWRLFLYVMMPVMELLYTLVELLDELTGNMLVSMLLAGFSMLLLLSLFVGGERIFCKPLPLGWLIHDLVGRSMKNNFDEHWI